MTTKVLIVDDHPAVREGLSLRISGQPDLEVCGEAADAVEAMELLDATHPDVAVVDVRLKDGDGIQLIKRMKSQDDSIRILVWSMYPDSLYAGRALRAGALGYVNKEETTGRIVEAIRSVRDGQIYVSPETAQLLLQVSVSGDWEQSPIELLSDRELQVFQLIGDGLSTSQIANRIHVSVHTVETHRQRIKRKLKLKSAADLTRDATRWALDQTQP